MQNRKRSNMAALLQYTILFCILVLGIYGVLIINHKSFIQVGDGIKQGYFWTAELKHQMEKLLAGEGLQLWSWSKLLGMCVQTNRYWDPFNWIAAAFPVGYIELGYTVATLLRLYCGGVAFLALMRYSDLSVFASVSGAALYTFTGYSIVTGLYYTDLLINGYLFPILVLSVEAVYKGKSPAFFSIATGLYLLSNFYFAYMAAITIILYILLRYFAYKEFELIDYAKNTGRFVVYGVIGICIGGIQFVPDFAALSKASLDSAMESPGLLFDKYYYIRIGEKLLGVGDTANYAIIGWTVILIMLLAISVIGLRLSKTPAVMSLILLAGTMIPIVCSIYNGFSYPNRRWIFSLQLFAAWAAAVELDGPRISKRPGNVTAAIALGFTAFLSLGFNYLFKLGLGKRSVSFMAIQLIGGTAFFVILVVAGKEGYLRKLSKIMILAVLSGTLTAAWTISFMDKKASFYRNNRINKMLQASTQRAGALIDEEGFYRLDQVDSILYSHRAKTPPNETLWWQTRSIYGYNSRMPSDLLEFNRLTGNNYGYSKRMAVISNDNRVGLDYLYGVKYFLGDDLKNGRRGSDEYAGYGFEYDRTIDGVRVFKSKYDVSLGYVFDQYISVSELEKLGYAEREQALLQAVVMPDDKDLAFTHRIKSDDIQTAVKDIGYSIAESDGAILKDDSIVVNKAGGSITLELDDVDDSQLEVAITGLLRNASDEQSEPFDLHITNEYVEEWARLIVDNQAIPNIKDFNLNLGYYDKYRDGKIRISFSAPGNYKYDSIKVRAMDADVFDDCIEALSNKRLIIDSFSDTEVEGRVDAGNGGVLFLSITEPENWDCYIDGENAKIIKNTDIAFTGVEIPEGHHNIMLKYNNYMAKAGMMLSLTGIIMLAAACLLRKRKQG
ncbi:MAG: YfhO family protein [Lachnospiraceae bacterium]|nr:YfhO family protein [Lachnospiraceae bacterium]